VSEAKAGRKPRADAERNRERLLEAAKAGFAETGPDISLDEIARRAGVGIGTLYRHFPTREALIEAVYRREVEQIADAATELLAARPAGEALHEWMRQAVAYIGAKKVIVAALGPMTTVGPDLAAASGTKIVDAMSMLVERAVASGDIRADVAPLDMLRAMAGFAYGAAEPGWETSALKLVDILMDGLRAR
jgi:AcrR family transcriptional regulator